MTVKIIFMGVVALMIVLCYSLCVIAHDADEKAKRMYMMWKEQKNDREGQGKN